MKENLTPNLTKTKTPNKLSKFCYQGRAASIHVYETDFIVIAGNDDDLAKIWKVIGSVTPLDISKNKDVIIAAPRKSQE